MNKKARSRKRKGFMDAAANMVLSAKHNRALPGGKHQIIYLPDGTYSPAVFSGPGTNLDTRLRRGDKPLSYVDKVAMAHDLRYGLSGQGYKFKSEPSRLD